ncbi:MAG: PEP-utilizing enzyme [Patescibacteria group bacterium]|nr:PEP-utilizing enzyme [Patescibacteria group bacterium]
MKQDTSQKDIYIKNFSVERCGYHMMTPIVYGIPNCQRILFGQNASLILKDCFFRIDDVNLTGGYFHKNQIRELIEKIINKILDNPEKVEKIDRETYDINTQYFDFAKEILKKDLTKLSNKELGELYSELSEWQEKAHQHALTTTWFVDSDGEDLSKLLIKKTKEFCEKSGTYINFAKAFSVLTTSDKESLGAKEEIESLKILKEIIENENAKKMFVSLEDYNKIPDGLDKKIAKKIQDHFEEWRWMRFTYMGPAYDIDFFLQIWAGLIRQGIDVDKEIKEREERLAGVRKERTDLFEKLKVDKEFQRIYDIAADITNLKGYRKDCSFFGFYVLDSILREAAKRLYLSLGQIHLLAFWELEKILIHGEEVDINEINRRKKIVILVSEGDKYYILSGHQAQKFYDSKNIEEIKIDKNVKELSGTCACSGEAKGTVKIVNKPEEMGKMNQGDVMVSHTTFPSLVPAMKKASAIITEDGGITCHAAIVARELGTPCITGIKTATKVLEDGDMVEVDADNGIVKIIKKA